MAQNKTAVFLGPTYSWTKSTLELRDVQPLFGGVIVKLPGWTMGEAYITRVAPDGTESKYRLRLKIKEKQELIDLCVAQDFLTIQPTERPGIPDEARPTLTLTNSKKESHTIAKWAGVADTRFEAIYQAMLALTTRKADMRPIKPRFNAWQKGLAITGIIVGALLLLLPAYNLAQSLVAPLWPEQFGLLFFLLLFLMILLLGGMRGLAMLERRKAAGDRTFTHFWVAVAVNLLFAVAAICLIGLGETAVRLWRSSEVLAIGDERVLYGVLGYTAVFTAGFLLAAAGLIMPRLRPLIDERF
jgi:hypothetical protein